MITVIIPAYNSEAYICRCLDSLLEQTYRDWEAVVIDDGSTDSTPEIVGRYMESDQRFRLISIANSGQSTARNIGLEAARGEWISFLDSDDAFRPTMLEVLLSAAQTTGAPISSVGYEIVREIPTVQESQSSQSQAVTIVDGRDGLLDILYQNPGGVSPSVWDKLWNRKFIGGERFLDGVYYEDLEFSARLVSRADKVAIVTEKLYYYVATPGSFLHTFSERRFDSLKVTLKMEQDFQSDPESLRATRERTMSAAFNILWLLTINSDRRHRYNDMARRCWTVIRERRLASILNRRVRLKNRCAALLSYLGPSVTEAALRLGNRFMFFRPHQTY